jgi:hypothetical protein
VPFRVEAPVQLDAVLASLRAEIVEDAPPRFVSLSSPFMMHFVRVRMRSSTIELRFDTDVLLHVVGFRAFVEQAAVAVTSVRVGPTERVSHRFDAHHFVRESGYSPFHVGLTSPLFPLLVRLSRTKLGAVADPVIDLAVIGEIRNV